MSDAQLVSVYPVELQKPDIAPYRAGNTGIPYVTTLDSGKPGPHVMVSALMHGNELSGAIALDTLFKAEIRPRHGRLTLAFFNVAAFERFDRAEPSASRFVHQDMNRLWSPAVLSGGAKTIEVCRARELLPLIESVDHLLDLHSMQHGTPPLVLCGLTDKARSLALCLGYPPWIVSDAGHAAGPRLIDYGDFAQPGSRKSALLVECGQHWERRAPAVALETISRFLRRFDMVTNDFVQPYLTGGVPPLQKVVEVTEAVTVTSDAGFVFADRFIGMEVLENAGTLIGRDGQKEVRTPYDNCVLIMPSQRLQKGQTAVRLGRLVR